MPILTKKLANVDDSDTFAEILAKLYEGKTIELYLGEKSGSNLYSDHDVEQKVYVTGKVLGAAGHCLLLECTIVTPASTFTVEIPINGWAITGAMEKREGSTIHVSHIFQEMKR